jgi:ferredoxin-NADP reductase
VAALCGPAAFVADLSAGLAASGVSSNRIHTEIFGAGPSLTPGIAANRQEATKVVVNGGGKREL